METLDLEGMFWLPGNPGRKVAGRFTFNDADGPELKLIGSLHDPNEVLTRHSGPVVSVPLEELYGSNIEPSRIFGETTQGFVTLDNCWRKSGTFRWPGSRRPAQEYYGAWAVFLGAHFDEDSSPAFSGVSTRIQNLENWTGMSLVRITLGYSEESKRLEEVRIVAGQPREMVTESALGEVGLSLEYMLKGDHIVESAITQRQAIQLRFPEPKSIAGILAVCSSLRDVVTIGTNTPVSIHSVSLTHPCSDNPIGFYAGLIGAVGQGSLRSPRPGEFLFTFEDIGGLGGLAKWLEVAQRYPLVIDALLSPEYRSPWYVESRFFDAITAAETFARIQGQYEHVNRYKIKQLGRRVGDPFEALVGDVDKWADRVWDARRDDLVHRGLSEVKPPTLYTMSESLYFLVVLSLLKECGAPGDAFASIQNHHRFRRCSEEWRENFG